MPIYEYVCPTCGEFEQMQKITEPVLTVCPEGHAGVERKISASGFILKGSGWYVTDYARKGANGKAAASGDGSGEQSSTTGKAEKPGTGTGGSGATAAPAAVAGKTST